jgi:hypothetical protein
MSWLLGSRGSQRVGCDWQSELLAEEAADESAAAYFTPIFETA